MAVPSSSEFIRVYLWLSSVVFMFPFFKRRTEEDDQAKARSYEVRGEAARADLLWKQGGKLLERKKYERAINSMRQASQLEPSRLEGRLNLGAALYLTGQHDEAITHFKYVLAFDAQNTVALLNLAAAQDGAGDLDSSIATLEILVTERPTWKDAHYNLAVALFKRGRTEEAAQALKTELHLNPSHELARTLLNKIHLMLPKKPKPGDAGDEGESNAA
jgi:tetratricopeptide (TPR) repeat protein